MNKINEVLSKHSLTKADLTRKMDWPTYGRLANYTSNLRQVTIPVGYEIVKGLKKLGVDCTFQDIFPDPYENDEAA